MAEAFGSPNGVQNPSPILEGDGCFTCDGSSVGSSSGSDGYINARWTAGLTGLFRGPWDINFGGVLTAREGYIRGLNVRPSSIDGVRRRYVINNFDDYRFENLFQMDLRIGKEFRLPAGIGFEVSADAFNVTNARTVLWQDYELTPRTTGGRWLRRHSRGRTPSTSAGMSPRRARSGGAWSSTTRRR